MFFKASLNVNPPLAESSNNLLAVLSVSKVSTTSSLRTLVVVLGLISIIFLSNLPNKKFI